MGNSGPNGFNGSTTAEQAAGNCDLTGKWALVTGTYSSVWGRLKKKTCNYYHIYFFE